MLKPKFDSHYFQELSLSIEEIESLTHFQHDILEAIALSKDHIQILEYICEFAEKLVPQSVSSIMLLNNEGSFNVLVAPSVPEEGKECLNGLKPGKGNGSCATAVYCQEPQFVFNTYIDPRWSNVLTFAKRFNVCSCWSWPIYGKNNNILGSFAISSFAHREPDPFHSSLLNIASYLIGIILQKQELTHELTHLAFHDPLTDLPNRHALLNYLEEKITISSFNKTNQNQFAILFLDLDRFKNINDLYGHTLGDSVLCCIADRIKPLMNDSSYICRLGGDEFIIILSSQNNSLEAEIDNFAQQVLKALQEPIETPERTFYLTGSIGVSFYPQHGQKIQTLLSNADIAMYEAKKSGGNKYSIYSQKFSQQTLKLFSLEHELRKAIVNDELEVFYQPKVNNNRNYSFAGAEALLRWRHPRQGLISPSTFIPIAEESGLITQIGEWVVRKTCEQLKTWQQQGQNINLSINLSNKQVTWSSINQLLEIVKESGVNPEGLEFEITETCIMKDLDNMCYLLSHIKASNIKIGLDDFGTGYSSLGMLKSLPVDTLKIDKSLIKNITKSTKEQSIFEAIITLGKALDLNIVVEGVETPAQTAFLAKSTCDMLQGFYFNKPLEVSQFEKQYLGFASKVE